jgi:hypothetical protein
LNNACPIDLVRHQASAILLAWGMSAEHATKNSTAPILAINPFAFAARAKRNHFFELG